MMIGHSYHVFVGYVASDDELLPFQFTQRLRVRFDQLGALLKILALQVNELK